MDRRRAYRQVVAVGLLWGTIGPAAAFVGLHTSLSPVQTSWWRLAIAVLPLAALAALAGRRRRRARPGARLLLAGMAVGAGAAGSQSTYFASVHSTGIAVATLSAAGLGPVLSAVGETLLYRERPDARTVAALLAALGGLGLLVLDGEAKVTAAGVALAVVSAVLYAAYALAAGPLMRRMDALTLNALAAAGGVVVLLPIVLVAAGGPGLPTSALGWLGLAHLGLVVSGLAYWLFFGAARALPTTHITIIVLLEPLAAAIIAAAAFGERLGLAAITGGALLLAAVAGLRVREEAQTAAPAPP